MVDPRVFVSFDFDHNETEKILFIGQSRNSKTPFSIQNWSAKSSMPQSQWETLVKEKINICNILIVLVGKTMASASGVSKEIVLTADQVIFAGARPDQNLNYETGAENLTSEFEAYCRENRDQLDALSVLYARPYRQRITRAKLVELAQAIQRPPRQWTTEALWQAYEQVEANRVKGASKGKHLTDLISLARHALGVEDQLVSFQDQAAERFAGWLAQQANRGRSFSSEQLGWLELIRDQIVVDLEVRMEDLDEPPFAQQGGQGSMYQLFGEELGAIVSELNDVVAT